MSFLTLTDAKAFLEVNYTVQDTIIQILIDGVEEFVEDYCGLGLTEITVTDEFTDGGGKALWPRRGPVASVSKILMINDANDEEEISANEFRIANNSQLIRDDAFRWFGGRRNFKITYVGGFATGKVPGGLKVLLLQMVFREFHNRGGKASEGAAGFTVSWQGRGVSDQRRRLDKYRRHGIVG